MAINVCGDAQRGGCDTDALVLWELADDARRLVCASSVFVDGSDDVRRLLISFRLNVIQRLEDPSQGIDAEIKESTTCKIRVDHTVRVRELEVAGTSVFVE
jgi:hypothetical protein